MFDSDEAAIELIEALVIGLWHRVSRHQELSAPFRLTRPEVSASHDALATLVGLRREEIDGFMEGLFGGSASQERRSRRTTRSSG